MRELVDEPYRVGDRDLGDLAFVRRAARIRALAKAERFRPYLGNFKEPWFFSDAETAAKNLRAAGFEQVETDIEPALTRFDDSEQFSQFVRTAIVHRHLKLLPSENSRND